MKIKIHTVAFKSVQAIILLAISLAFYISVNTNHASISDEFLAIGVYLLLLFPFTVMAEWIFSGLRLLVVKILKIRRSKKDELDADEQQQ